MRLCIVLICLAVCSVSFGQSSQPPAGQPTLRQQYANLKSDLEVINGFRMVKLYEMDQLWRVIEDSLKTKREAINQGLAIARQQADEINALKAQVAKTESEKEELASDVANIDVFGIAFSKGGFVMLATCLVVGLLVLVGILFVISKVAYKSARESKKVSDELYKEFEDYKHMAVEKNIKLSRELQSLKNRMADLKIA